MADNIIGYSYEQLYDAIKIRLAPVTMLSDFQKHESGIGMYGFCFNYSINLSQLRCFCGLFNMCFVYDNISCGSINNTVRFHKDTDRDLKKSYFFNYKGEEYIFDILALSYDYECEEIIPDILIAGVFLQLYQDVCKKHYGYYSDDYSFIKSFINKAKKRFASYNTKWWSTSCKHIIPLEYAICNIKDTDSITMEEYLEFQKVIITADVDVTADNIINIYKNIFKDEFVCVVRFDEFTYDYFNEYARYKEDLDNILATDVVYTGFNPSQLMEYLQDMYTNISHIETNIILSNHNTLSLNAKNAFKENYIDRFPRKKNELLKLVEAAYTKVSAIQDK